VYRPLASGVAATNGRSAPVRRLGDRRTPIPRAVTHGLAIALYADLTFAEWRAMPFPAVIER
jgi:hypothetical protein